MGSASAIGGRGVGAGIAGGMGGWSMGGGACGGGIGVPAHAATRNANPSAGQAFLLAKPVRGSYAVITGL